MAPGITWNSPTSTITWRASEASPCRSGTAWPRPEFGLSGIAEKEHVERLCAGFDPHDPSKRLVRNAGKETRNPGHDLTFSAPKSLSCAWSVADPELKRAIEEKHRAAVKAALSFLEEKVGFARVGTDGQERVRCPLLFALFDHGTSRAEDQQLHTHALLINVDQARRRQDDRD